MRFYRWVGLVMGIWVMAITGTNYTFSNYSSALKSALGINQAQLNALSTAKDLSIAVGILVGVTSEYVPAWALLMIGSMLGILGFGVQWLIVARIIDTLPYWTIFVASIIAGNSASWFNTAVLLVSVRNFPRNRGPVAGLLNAYVGLSAAIFSALCDLVFSDSSSNFVLMLTIVPATVCFVAAFFLRPVPPARTAHENKVEQRSVFAFNALAASLAVYIFVVVEIFPANSTLMERLDTTLLLLLLVAPIVVPVVILLNTNVPVDLIQEKQNKDASVLDVAVLDEKLRRTAAAGTAVDVEQIRSPNSANSFLQPLMEVHTEVHSDQNQNDADKKLQRHYSCCNFAPLQEQGEDRSLLEVLRSFEFWVFYVSCVCAAGTGVAFSNNLGQIVMAITGLDTATTYTALFSLGSFFGRLLSGILAEHFLRRAAVPRSVWMAISKLPMVAIYLWMAAGSPKSLYVGTVVIGFCYGLQMSNMIPMVSELYGLKHFGTNYNACISALLVGSLLFSSLLAGILYDRAAARQENQQPLILMSKTQGFKEPSNLSLHFRDDSVTCYGPECYGVTFVVMSVTLVVGLVLDVILTFKTKRLYVKLQRINTVTCR